MRLSSIKSTQKYPRCEFSQNSGTCTNWLKSEISVIQVRLGRIKQLPGFDPMTHNRRDLDLWASTTGRWLHCPFLYYWWRGLKFTTRLASATLFILNKSSNLNFEHPLFLGQRAINSSLHSSSLRPFYNPSSAPLHVLRQHDNVMREGLINEGKLVTSERLSYREAEGSQHEAVPGEVITKGKSRKSITEPVVVSILKCRPTKHPSEQHPFCNARSHVAWSMMENFFPGKCH